MFISELMAVKRIRARSNRAGLAHHQFARPPVWQSQALSDLRQQRGKGQFEALKTARPIRARVEHDFAHQKNRYGLFIRTIGIARTLGKLTLANLAYNFDRLIFQQRHAATR